MYAAESVSAVSQMWRSTYVAGRNRGDRNTRTGKICGFFGTDCEYVIPFSCIKKIGPDIVLVEIKEEKFLQNFKACGIIIAHIENGKRKAEMLMRCPYCGNPDTRVIDSRPAEDKNSIRRRRSCDECGRRFTTYEKVETIPLML